MFEPAYNLVSNLVPFNLSEEEVLFIKRLVDLLEDQRPDQEDGESTTLKSTSIWSDDTLYLDYEGLGAKILEILINGFRLVPADEWWSCGVLADKVAGSMILAYGRAASKTSKTLSDEEMDNVYRASLGQPVIFERLRKEQLETVAREAMAFAKAMNFKVMVARQMAVNLGDYSAVQFLADRLDALEEPSLQFVNELTGGRPNKQAGLIEISNAGSFLAGYFVSLQIGDSHRSREDNLNPDLLRGTLIELGKARVNLAELLDRTRLSTQRRFELIPYVRYISRGLEHGRGLREPLEDLVNSDPETPLKTAFGHALTHLASLEAGLVRELEVLEEPYDREFFEILLSDFKHHDTDATIEALNLFYTRLLEARKQGLAQA
jgi:hypothetical protein